MDRFPPPDGPPKAEEQARKPRSPDGAGHDLANWFAERISELAEDPREEVRRIARRLHACMECETSAQPGRCTDCLISAFRWDGGA